MKNKINSNKYKSTKLILLFIFLFNILYPSVQAQQTQQQKSNIICIEESELQAIIEDEINKAVTQSVAVAVKEKELQIIDLKIQNLKLTKENEQLKNENTNLVISLKREKTINLVLSISIGAIVIGSTILYLSK